MWCDLNWHAFSWLFVFLETALTGSSTVCHNPQYCSKLPSLLIKLNLTYQGLCVNKQSKYSLKKYRCRYPLHLSSDVLCRSNVQDWSIIVSVESLHTSSLSCYKKIIGALILEWRWQVASFGINGCICEMTHEGHAINS